MDEKAKDSELIRAHLAGDAAALGILVEKYRRPLYGYIYNMTGGSEDADDIFQETWMRAIRRLPRFRHDNFVGWLVRIAHNRFIDGVRKQKPGFSLDEDAYGESAGTRGSNFAGCSASPTETVANRELGAKIRRVVHALPTEQREVFVLREEAGMPFKEIAAIQRTSINTALARMQYALRKLREELRDDYNDLAAYAVEE